MPERRRATVLVVGAGPVGLFTALCLRQRGIDVHIIDEQWRPAVHSYALALHPRSLALLDEVGLADDVLRHGRQIDRLVFYHGSQRVAELSLDVLDAPFPCLLVLPQSDLESLLEKRLNHAGVRVQWNHRLARLQPDTDAVHATIERLGKVSEGYPIAMTEWVVEKTIPFTADFVIGADGHRSRVRRDLGINFAAVREPEIFAVFEFDCPDAALAACTDACVVFDAAGTSALWPLPGGRCRWGFQVSPQMFLSADRVKSRLVVQVGDQAFPGLGPDDLAQLLAERAPWFGDSAGQIEWAMAVRFERRLAASFGRDRVWLAGDAAHLTGPVGAQSMNIGLREAHDLASHITRVLHGHETIDRLAHYEDQRRREWMRLLGLEPWLAPAPDAPEWVRLNLDRIIPVLPASGEDFVLLAGQIGLAPITPRAAS